MIAKCFLIPLVLGLLVVFSAPGQDVIITEFLTSNSSSIQDEDGEHEDWIEVHNRGISPVNLLGWTLSDRADDSGQWTFPSTNLPPGGFLVVFASGKDRRVPGGRLHTNFRLSSTGEYLGLFRPDGSVASEFSTEFPPQALDVSYGFGETATNRVLLASNAPVRVRVPSSGAEDPAWRSTNFNDSAWLAGTNGVGYGSSNAALADYSVPVLATSPVGYWRLNESSGTVAANIGSGAGMNGAYSGTSLGVAGPRPPPFNGFEPNNNAAGFNGSSASITVPSSPVNNRGSFTVGGWVRPTGPQHTRTGLFGQNDCVEFGFINTSTLQCWTPGGGALDVGFPHPANNWYHIVAVGDGTNIRIYTNGVLGGTGGAATANYGSSASPFNIGGGGIFDASTNFFLGQIDEVVAYQRPLSAAEVLSLYRAGTNASGVSVVPYVRTDIGPAMSNVNASAYIRMPFVVPSLSNLSLMTLNARYDDGFVAYVNGIEIARLNAPESTLFNSAASGPHSPFGTEVTTFGSGALVEGTNILAIHALNVAANDSDFLFAAELSVSVVTDSSAQPVYFTRPTPGQPNDQGTPVIGPAILDVSHTPNVPLAGQDIHVTARVTPTFNDVASVSAWYRVMFNNPVQVPMFDDGLHGDSAAGDGIWGTTLPVGAGSTNGQMVRWFFVATDSQSKTSRWPLFTAPSQTEYLGTMVQTNVNSKLPVIHLFIGPSQLAAVDTQTGGRGVSVFYDGEFYDNVYMELRGNTTASYTKKSHRIEFNREHPFRHAGAYFGAPIPGDPPAEAPRVRHTSFVADYPDPTYMRQGLSFWLAHQLGAPSSFYYPVRLHLNGSFYQLANHNDVHDEELLERLGYDPRGALYNGAGTVVPSKFSTGGFDKKTRRWETTDPDYAVLATALAETVSVAQRKTNVFQMFDIPEAINYLVAARWAHENDDVWANLSLYHDNDGDDLWRIVPFDMNLSFGAIFHEGGNPAVIEGVQATNDIHKAHPLYGASTTLALSGPGAPNNFNRVYDAFFLVPELREMFLRRMRTMLDTYVGPPGTPVGSSIMEQKIVAWYNLIREEAIIDRARWQWPAKGGQSNFDPGINITNGVNALLTNFFLARRHHFYGKHSVLNTNLAVGITKNDNAGIPRKQLNDVTLRVAAVEYNPTSGNQAHEYIALTNPMPVAVDVSGWKLQGAVDFTFAPGTVVPRNSLVYVSPDVRAFRSRTTGPRGNQALFIVGPYEGQLSARGETIFLADAEGNSIAITNYVGTPSLAQQSLRITELMYHPSPIDANDPNEYEYVELKNIGGASLSLAGTRFVNGIEFTFTNGTLGAGQRLILAKNSVLFASRYGATPVAGQYSGSLDNAGERIQLVDAAGEEILDFSYNNAWYPVTDGHGFSLVMTNELAVPEAWNLKTHWRPSGQLDGSPGANDPAPTFIAPIRINEVLSRSDVPPPTDSIELYNPTASAVDISGWYLSDDFIAPQKFRIPNGTTIPAGGYIVFDESQFNSGGPFSFALSSDDDEVHLFSADPAGNLTGYEHGFDFGAADDGVTFGRHAISTGAEHFVAQISRTLGSTNAGPKTGPVIINEIMHSPADVEGADHSPNEYVELLNISGATLQLFDPLASENRWKITGGIDFVFPSNTTINAGELILLVGFDPVADPATAASFRARFGVDGSTRIFGPYEGRLNNGGDNVELKKPATPAAANVAYVLVDKVEYDMDAGWPATGEAYDLSLHRKGNTLYGNDPANWAAAPPSPGAELASPGSSPIITQSPASQQAIFGDDVSFSVAATGSNLEYQWFFNGDYIPGATGSTLALTDVNQGEAGSYAVLVSSGSGWTISSAAELTLAAPAFFLSQPRQQFVTNGADAVFSVSVYSENAPVTYQWRRDGSDIPGATGAAFTIPDATRVDEGVYSVVVTDAVGSVVSDDAPLLIQVKPVLIELPQSRTVAVGSTVSFSVAVSNDATLPLTYRWRTNANFASTTITNALTSSFTLTNIRTNQAYHMTLQVTNQAGGTTPLLTPVAYLVVVVPPTNQTTVAGSDVTLSGQVFNSVQTAAALRSRVQWQFNGVNIDGATNQTLVLTNVQSGDLGTYSLLVTNPANMVTAFPAVVSFAPDNPQLLNPQLLGNGHFQATLQGIPGRTYAVEYSTNLVNWILLESFSAASESSLVTDESAPGSPQRFYRAILDP